MRRTGVHVSILLLLLFACGSWPMLANPNADETKPTDSYMGLTGEELWSNNCMRCHNVRPPTMYTDAQWDVIVHHMRLRANITGQEQRAIVEFLKSAK
ncbi:MAG TPA: hypothetical protein VFA51_10565 [Candidatus Udaeobacter sp.]|nr:hypothetical protein [Candidatus Udaeobacter sp.]